MPTKSSRYRLSIGVLLAIACLCAGRTAWAQSESPGEHIILPPATAGTPLSFQIQAEAAYVAARGDLVESMAIARKINAEAVSLELDNALRYVDTYFRRRELNREWRNKRNPNYLKRQEYIHNAIKQRMKERFSDVLKDGDLSEELNWLLAELSAPMLAYQLLSSRSSFLDSDLDPKLEPADVALIRLSDGTPGAGAVGFSAADAKVLEVLWPPALRTEKFAPLRQEFDSCRDQVLAEIRQDRQATTQSGDKLIVSVSNLLTALEEAYPKEARRNCAVFARYSAAKRYLCSLAAEARRTIQWADPSLFDGSLRFEGDSLLDLLQHINRRGLVFAPAPAGADREYRSLLTGMRNLYFACNEEGAGAKAAGP